MNPVSQLRLYLRLKPVLDQLRKEMHMKFSWNLVVQVLGTTAQGLNQLAPFASSERTKTGIALGVGVIQALAALLAHYSNPDGTSAQTAWIKPGK